MRVGIIHLSTYALFICDENHTLLGAFEIPRSYIESFLAKHDGDDRRKLRNSAGLSYLLSQPNVAERFGWRVEQLAPANQKG